jgi:pentatricopeptide repeat protein
VSFEQTLRAGDLDRARVILGELASLPDTAGLWMPECYADLARSYGHRGRHDDAIAMLELAIEHGWGGRPDPRSDIAEFHLRAGRSDEAGRSGPS